MVVFRRRAYYPLMFPPCVRGWVAVAMFYWSWFHVSPLRAGMGCDIDSMEAWNASFPPCVRGWVDLGNVSADDSHVSPLRAGMGWTASTIIWLG